MKEFKELAEIVDKLSDEEYKFCRSFKQSNSIQESSISKLLRLIKEGKEYDIKGIQEQLYGAKKDEAFKKLVIRSRTRVLDCLLLSESIITNVYYDDRAKEILTLRKQLIQFDMLNLRGASTFALKLVNKIIAKTKLYEYYDLLVFAMYKKLRLSGAFSTQEAYQKQLIEIEYYENCRSTYHKLELYHKSFYLLLNERKKVVAQRSRILKIVKEAESDYLRTDSKSIRYYYLLFKAFHLELEDELEKSCSTWMELIALVQGNKYLNSTHGLANAYINLARVYLLVFDFERCSSALKRTLQLIKYFDPHASTYYNFKFLCGFYSGSKKSIELNLEILVSYLYSGIIVLYVADMVKFYHSCIKFIESEYSASYFLLNDVKALEQDKEAWNIAIRVLSIMNQIELENYEIADNLIDNLRKYHERIKKTLIVSKRDEKIIQILIALSGHSYHFRTTYRKKSDAFNLLDSMDTNYRWKIVSPEMIVFHEWFKAKTENTKYDHFEVMPRMMKKYSALKKPFVSSPEDVKIHQ